MLPGRMTTRSEDPSLADAVVRVLESGQRIVLDRVDLARFDLAQLAARVLRGAVLIGVGAVLLAGAWFAAMAGVVVWLYQSMSLTLASSLALVGALSGLAGTAAIVVGVRRARPNDMPLPGQLRGATET